MFCHNRHLHLCDLESEFISVLGSHLDAPSSLTVSILENPLSRQGRNSTDHFPKIELSAGMLTGLLLSSFYPVSLTKSQHNDIVVLMIPEFVDVGGPWKVLPMGIHDATLKEVEERFATNKKRASLFRGLERACKALQAAGCTVIYLDGSYTTDAPFPNDYDVCWNTFHVDDTKLDPVFYDFTNKRSNQKSKYGGEFFPASAKADGSHLFIQYFQQDKATGLEKGIIRIYL